MADLTERLEEEYRLLLQRYPSAEFQEAGRWFLVHDYPLPDGWNRDKIDLAFQLPDGYPQTVPYGFYVPSGLRFGEALPGNFTDPTPACPSIGSGVWAFFSGNPDAWSPAVEASEGSNVVTWVTAIGERLREGA